MTGPGAAHERRERRQAAALDAMSQEGTVEGRAKAFCQTQIAFFRQLQADLAARLGADTAAKIGAELDADLAHYEAHVDDIAKGIAHGVRA